MGYGRKWMAVLAFFSLVTGCARVTTQVVDKPRVDQETRGNRGFLAGSGPPAPPRKPTRQMIQTDVELPTWEEMNPWRKRKAMESSPASVAAGQESSWEEPMVEEPEPMIEPVRGESYTVQKGDTLEKISQRFYGTPKKWRRIYDANQEVLKSPDRVYPGQKLQIPPAERFAPADSDLNFK